MQISAYGYEYAQETQLYYLQSRYYNPHLGRFLNADALTSTGQGFVGNNMFAYCNNNPVTFFDPAGNFPWIIIPFIIPFVLVGCSSGDPDGGTSIEQSPKPSDYIESNNLDQNCYGYAFGIDGSKDPGKYSNPLPSDTVISLYNNGPIPDIRDLEYLVMRDMAAMGKNVRVIYDPAFCDPDEYLVVAKIGTELALNGRADYHFAVQLSNGNWADKRGKFSSQYNCIDGFAESWDLLPGDGYYNSRPVYFAVGK